MPVRRQLLAASLTGGAALSSAAAQQQPAAAVPEAPAPAPGRAGVVGRLRTPDSAAVGGAEVTLVGEGATGDAERGQTVRSGPGGTFRLDGLAPGRYLLRVRRLGYGPVYATATLRADQTARFDVRMGELPATLAQVDVKGESGFGRFADYRFQQFERRRRAGFGTFFTREDLRPYQGRFLYEVLPYLNLRGRGRGGVNSAFVGNSAVNVFAGGDNPWGYNTGLGTPTPGWAEFPRLTVSSYFASAPAALAGTTGLSVNGGPGMSADFARDILVDEIAGLEVDNGALVVWTTRGAG